MFPTTEAGLLLSFNGCKSILLDPKTTNTKALQKLCSALFCTTIEKSIQFQVNKEIPGFYVSE